MDGVLSLCSRAHKLDENSHSNCPQVLVDNQLHCSHGPQLKHIILDCSHMMKAVSPGLYCCYLLYLLSDLAFRCLQQTLDYFSTFGMHALHYWCERYACSVVKCSNTINGHLKLASQNLEIHDVIFFWLERWKIWCLQCLIWVACSRVQEFQRVV